MSVCVCVHVCVSTHVHAHMFTSCECMWKPEVNIKYLSQSRYILFFHIASLIEAGAPCFHVTGFLSQGLLPPR